MLPIRNGRAVEQRQNSPPFSKVEGKPFLCYTFYDLLSLLPFYPMGLDPRLSNQRKGTIIIVLVFDHVRA